MVMEMVTEREEYRHVISRMTAVARVHIGPHINNGTSRVHHKQP
jgi:hypothetical protein